MIALVKRLGLLVLIFTSFFACEDESPTLIDVPEALVGEWRQVSEVNANCPDPANNGTEAKSCSINECLEYTFKADGTFTRRSVEDGNRNVEANTFTLNGVELFIEGGTELEIFAYELFENQLNLIYRDDRNGCTIIQVFEMS